jgi:tetratricopeptide (TPR) repeat protein
MVSFIFVMAQNTEFNAGPRLNAPPSGDPSREAVASLRGYAYQLYTSALAWIDLRSDEELYLEVAEDYAVAAQDALKAVQVKDTGPSSVTINSEGIQDALNSYVDLVERNPQANVFVHYLSTSPIGQERAVADRAAGNPTLEYWRSAAAAADVAPLRKVLLAAGLSEKVNSFINARDDQALRDDFLKRVQWDCGQPDVRAVQEILAARLDRYCSEELELYADDGEHLVGSVLMHVLNTIVHAKPRRLNSFGLRKVLENATTVRVPRNAANAILRQAAAGLSGSSNQIAAAPTVLATEADLPLPAFLTRRRSLLDEVIARLRTHGAAVITGSSGRGKTIIARLASRDLSNDIRIVDARNASPFETITLLSQAACELPGTRPSAVLLDDLNEMDDPGVCDALARMLSIIRRIDAVCVITAYNQPSGRSLTQAGLDPGACLAVPDLSTDEVKEMAVAGGCDGKWAQTLYLAGAFGHPQLVNALISGLRARGWPEDELKRLLLFERSDDVEAERVAARRQLVAALPENAKALLYRVSLTIGRFDRPIVLTLAELQPPIPAPGEQLDLLVGPWIEPYARQQYRVSPLVANAGEETLGPTSQLSVNCAIAEAYTAGSVFDIGKANAAFLHALRGKSHSALSKLAVGIIMAKQAVRKDLADWISGIRLHRTDRPIFEEDVRLSVLLRIAQLVLRAPSRDRGAVAETWHALQREVAQAAAAHPELEMSALGKGLIDTSLAALLPDWIGLILRFDALAGTNADFAALGEPIEGIKNPTVPGILFLMQASGIDSVLELKAVFDRLDCLSAEQRAALFTNVAELPSDFSLIVNHAWLAEPKKGIDWENCAQLYLEMAVQAQRWGYRQLALRCYIARGVMLDEYAVNPEGALAALNDAEQTLGADPALSRARAKIYYRRKDHASALALLRDSADKAARNDFIEQAFMFREAGISAAETGDWADAARWFDAAQVAGSKLVTDGMALMALGLVADRGIAEFQAGDLPKAIASLSTALEALSLFDPSSSLKAAYLHRVVRHAVLCVNLRVTGKQVLVPEVGAAIAPGMCSNPEPTDITDLPLGHIAIAWYLLAEAEIAGGAGTTVAESLRSRLGGKVIAMMETNLRGARLEASIKRSDVQGFFASLESWVEGLFYIQGLGQTFREFSALNPTYGEIPPASPEQFAAPEGQRHFANALFAFGIVASLQRRPEALQKLNSAMAEKHFSSELTRLAGVMAGAIEPKAQPEEAVEVAINQVATRASDLQPDEVFVAALQMIQFIARATLNTALTPFLADWLRERWAHAVDEQAFLLRNPATNIPAIRQVLAMQEHTLQYCAHFLATVAPAAKTRLDESFRTYLTNLSMPKPTPAGQN